MSSSFITAADYILEWQFKRRVQEFMNPLEFRKCRKCCRSLALKEYQASPTLTNLNLGLKYICRYCDNDSESWEGG